MELKDRLYRFKIDAFTPDTLPMARLGQYLQQLAALYGYRPSVHFSHLEESSAVVVSKVEPQDEPKVRDRIRRVKKRMGPKDAQDAYAQIDDMLRDDNAIAEVIEPDGDKVIEFPGRAKKNFDLVGPISELASLNGVPIVVGGQGEWVPVHLEDRDGTIYNCIAKRDDAKRIARYLFDAPLRVEGLGRWYRDRSGKWAMESFRIHDFRTLTKGDFYSALDSLREAHKKSNWASSNDPLDALDSIRNE